MTNKIVKTDILFDKNKAEQLELDKKEKRRQMIENAKRKKMEAEQRISSDKSEEKKKEKEFADDPRVCIKVEGQRSKKPTLARGWRLEKEKNK